jgi:hypothetical protein
MYVADKKVLVMKKVCTVILILAFHVSFSQQLFIGQKVTDIKLFNSDKSRIFQVASAQNEYIYPFSQGGIGFFFGVDKDSLINVIVCFDTNFIVNNKYKIGTKLSSIELKHIKRKKFVYGLGTFWELTNGWSIIAKTSKPVPEIVYFIKRNFFFD